MFTVNIWTSQLISILILKIEEKKKVNFTTNDVLKQETHRPWLTHLSETVIAYLQMTYNFSYKKLKIKKTGL